jgi:hypothetical protein
MKQQSFAYETRHDCRTSPPRGSCVRRLKIENPDYSLGGFHYGKGVQKDIGGLVRAAGRSTRRSSRCCSRDIRAA